MLKRAACCSCVVVILCALLPPVARAADEIHWTIMGQSAVSFDWRGTASEDFIRYGTAPGSYTDTVFAMTPVPLPYSSAGPFREARLTNLTEDTLYFYSIADGPEHTFRTPLPRGDSNFVVHVESDIGESTSYSNMLPVQDLIASDMPDFVLAAGDLTYGNAHGQATVDQHFNDVMVWSQDAAYMPSWGNHEWDDDGGDDDLRNYKGRFDLPNPQTSPGSPAISCCGEDWYWFDYGNVRFIAYPEPWSGAWADWAVQVGLLMDAAELDPDLEFVVTVGHRPAYSSGHHPGSATLQSLIDALGAEHPKYVLNLNGHSHNYERTFPQNGVVHVTAGAGGGTLQTDGACLWLTCTQPVWSAVRAFHHGTLRLHFTAGAIDGSFLCGPASSRDDVTCTVGEVIDSFTIGTSLPPDSIIDAPTGDMTIAMGESVDFAGTGTDPDDDFPLAYLWKFGGGAPDSTDEDPGDVTFDTPGIFITTFTVMDSTGRIDPTPDSRILSVTSPGGELLATAAVASSTDDAEESATGSIDLTSSDLEMVRDGTDQTVGMRFAGLTVPQGSTVIDAYVQFQVDEISTVATSLTLRTELTGDALPFTATPNDLSARTTTTAAVPWNPPPWTGVGEAGSDQQTPNLAPLVQQVIDRPDWQTGNALVVIVDGVGERVAESYDGDPVGAPLLRVEFTPIPEPSGLLGLTCGATLLHFLQRRRAHA